MKKAKAAARGKLESMLVHALGGELDLVAPFGSHSIILTDASFER